MSTPRIVVAILRRFLPLFAAFCVLQPLGAGEKNAPPPRPLRQWTLNGRPAASKAAMRKKRSGNAAPQARSSCKAARA